MEKWPDELVKVVWNHNTVVSRSTGFTLFKLLFGDEAITSEEAKARSIRTLKYEEAPKSFLQGCRVKIPPNKGEEAPKSFLRGCIAKLQSRSYGDIELKYHLVKVNKIQSRS
jgi:hypothetical protein